MIPRRLLRGFMCMRSRTARSRIFRRRPLSATCSRFSSGNLVSRDVLGFPCVVEEGVPNMGTGRSVWESGLRMVDYFLSNRHLVEGARVLELGTGTGMVGIATAMMGANVVLSDQNSRLLELVGKNIEKNVDGIRAGGGSARCRLLDWREIEHAEDVVDQEGPFDLVIGSDVLYGGHTTHPMLINTLPVVCSDSTRIFFTYPSRDLEYSARINGQDPVPPSEECVHKFAEKAKERFDAEIVAHYDPKSPRKGNLGYTIYVMEMRPK